MRLPLLAACAALVLVTPSVPANEAQWVIDTVDEVVYTLPVPYRVCTDGNMPPARLQDADEPCGAPSTPEKAIDWAECVIDDILGGGWPPTLQDCPEPIPATPCLYHQWQTCYERMGLEDYGIPQPPPVGWPPVLP